MPSPPVPHGPRARVPGGPQISKPETLQAEGRAWLSGGNSSRVPGRVHPRGARPAAPRRGLTQPAAPRSAASPRARRPADRAAAAWHRLPGSRPSAACLPAGGSACLCRAPCGAPTARTSAARPRSHAHAMPSAPCQPASLRPAQRRRAASGESCACSSSSHAGAAALWLTKRPQRVLSAGRVLPGGECCAIFEALSEPAKGGRQAANRPSSRPSLFDCVAPIGSTQSGISAQLLSFSAQI